MAGGGGDGGAAARAEADQKAKEKRIKSNIGLIDLLFKNDPTAGRAEFGALSEEREKLPGPIERPVRNVFGGVGIPDGQGGFTNRTELFDPAAERRAEIDARLATLKSAEPLLTGPDKKQREARVIGDVEDFFFEDLNEQRRDAERVSRFELARRGGLGGSQELDARERFQRKEDDARLKIGNVALDARNNLRTQDEEARAALIDQANRGLERDVLTSDFINTLDNSLSRSRDTAKLTRFDPFFEEAGNLFTNVELIRGNQAGRDRADRSLQSFFSANPSRNSGTVVR